MSFQINKNNILQQLDKSFVIFDPESSVLFSLNEMASVILQQIKIGKKTHEIISSITEAYDVDSKQVSYDVNTFIRKLLKSKVIEPKKRTAFK